MGLKLFGVILILSGLIGASIKLGETDFSFTNPSILLLHILIFSLGILFYYLGIVRYKGGPALITGSFIIVLAICFIFSESFSSKLTDAESNAIGWCIATILVTCGILLIRQGHKFHKLSNSINSEH